MLVSFDLVTNLRFIRFASQILCVLCAYATVGYFDGDAAATGSQYFSCVGYSESITVASGVGSILVEAYGAAGGGYGIGAGNDLGGGGAGGYATALCIVNAGDIIFLNVGCPGGTAGGVTKAGTAGFNGGGAGGSYGGSGGGGATDIRLGGANLANRIIVAGGGGGNGNDELRGPVGGAGGGSSGSSGTGQSGTGGGGGTQAAGGTAGCLDISCGAAGSSGFGGAGAETGGGGGGGYYGGGGAGANGGGGGSSYASPSYCTAISYSTSNPSNLDGSLTITFIQAPTSSPSSRPSSKPSTIPSSKPSRQPTSKPSSTPSMQPSSRPTRQPSGQPTTQPTSQPSEQPSAKPSRQPSTQPTASPSSQPSNQPTTSPSSAPTSRPTRAPISPDDTYFAIVPIVCLIVANVFARLLRQGGQDDDLNEISTLFVQTVHIAVNGSSWYLYLQTFFSYYDSAVNQGNYFDEWLTDMLVLSKVPILFAWLFFLVLFFAPKTAQFLCCEWAALRTPLRMLLDGQLISPQKSVCGLSATTCFAFVLIGSVFDLNALRYLPWHRSHRTKSLRSFPNRLMVRVCLYSTALSAALQSASSLIIYIMVDRSITNAAFISLSLASAVIVTLDVLLVVVMSDVTGGGLQVLMPQVIRDLLRVTQSREIMHRYEWLVMGDMEEEGEEEEDVNEESVGEASADAGTETGKIAAEALKRKHSGTTRKKQAQLLYSAAATSSDSTENPLHAQAAMSVHSSIAGMAVLPPLSPEDKALVLQWLEQIAINSDTTDYLTSTSTTAVTTQPPTFTSSFSQSFDFFGQRGRQQQLSRVIEGDNEEDDENDYVENKYGVQSRNMAAPTVILNKAAATKQGQIVAFFQYALLEAGLPSLDYLPLHSLQQEIFTQLEARVQQRDDYDLHRLLFLVRCLHYHPGFIAEKNFASFVWHHIHAHFLQECLQTMRGFVPPLLHESSDRDDLESHHPQTQCCCNYFSCGCTTCCASSMMWLRLLTSTTPTQQRPLTWQLLHRLSTRPCLWLVRMSTKEIDSLSAKSLIGRLSPLGLSLDLVEMAAIYASLPVMFSPENDPGHKKQRWRGQVEDVLYEMMRLYDQQRLFPQQIRHPHYRWYESKGKCAPFATVREGGMTSGSTNVPPFYSYEARTGMGLNYPNDSSDINNNQSGDASTSHNNDDDGDNDELRDSHMYPKDSESSIASSQLPRDSTSSALSLQNYRSSQRHSDNYSRNYKSKTHSRTNRPSQGHLGSYNRSSFNEQSLRMSQIYGRDSGVFGDLYSAYHLGNNLDTTDQQHVDVAFDLDYDIHDEVPTSAIRVGAAGKRQKSAAVDTEGGGGDTGDEDTYKGRPSMLSEVSVRLSDIYHRASSLVFLRRSEAELELDLVRLGPSNATSTTPNEKNSNIPQSVEGVESSSGISGGTNNRPYTRPNNDDTIVASGLNPMNSLAKNMRRFSNTAVSVTNNSTPPTQKQEQEQQSDPTLTAENLAASQAHRTSPAALSALPPRRPSQFMTPSHSRGISSNNVDVERSDRGGEEEDVYDQRFSNPALFAFAQHNAYNSDSQLTTPRISLASTTAIHHSSNAYSSRNNDHIDD